MTVEYSEDFLAFCHNATDNQLENILQKEYDASEEDESRLPDYHAAKIEAGFRGWIIKHGKRI